MFAEFAHLALQKLKISPRKFYDMDSCEQAFTIASILVQGERDKEQAEKINSKSKVKSARKR